MVEARFACYTWYFGEVTRPGSRFAACKAYQSLY